MMDVFLLHRFDSLVAGELMAVNIEVAWDWIDELNG